MTPEQALHDLALEIYQMDMVYWDTSAVSSPGELLNNLLSAHREALFVALGASRAEGERHLFGPAYVAVPDVDVYWIANE